LRPGRGSQQLTLAPDLAADAAALSPVFFAELTLADARGAAIDRNVYWLPVAADAYEWGPTDDNLPKVQPADLSALAGLPPVTLDPPAFTTAADGDDTVVTQVLANPTDGIAFFVEVLLADAATGMPVLPVRWDDNYVTLMPRETRTLTARVPTAAIGGRALRTVVSGWNVAP